MGISWICRMELCIEGCKFWGSRDLENIIWFQKGTQQSPHDLAFIVKFNEGIQWGEINH